MSLVRVLELTAVIEIFIALLFLIGSFFAQSVPGQIGLSGCAVLLMMTSVALIQTARHKSAQEEAALLG